MKSLLSISAGLICLGTTLACSSSGGGGTAATGGAAGWGTGGGGGSGGSGATGGSGGTVGDKVVVRDPRGKPVAGVDVVVHDATGAAIAQVQTGADGSASVNAPEGGALTVAWKTPDETWKLQTELVTVTDLPAVAELHVVADAFTDLPLRPFMLLNFTPPSDGTPWDVNLSCLSEHDMYETARQFRGCPGSDSFDVVVFYGDKRQVFANEKYEPGATRDYTLDPFAAEPAPQVKLTLASLPADVTNLGGTLQVPRDGGGWNQDSDGHNPQASPGPNLSFALLYAQPGAHYDLVAGVGDALTTERQWLYLPIDTLPNVPIEWTLSDLARIASVGPAAGSTSRPVVPWTLASSGSAGDAFRVTVQYQAPSTGMNPDRRRWRLYAPPTASSLELPALPGSLADLAPSTASSLIMVEHLELGDGKGTLAAANAESDRKAVRAVWTALSSQ